MTEIDNYEKINAEDSPLEQNETQTQKKKVKSKVDLIINITLWIVLAILVVLLVLRVFVFSSIKVDGISMNPTYESEEVVVVNKVLSPNRGDVVVFYKYDIDSKFKAMFASKKDSVPNGPYEKLIKRVVALQGDKIWVNCISDNGSTQIWEVIVETADGQTLKEDYYERKGEVLPQITISSSGVGLGILANCTKSKPFVVSQGCIFAMGDNRLVSADSRGELGEVPLSRMYGVVLDR